MTTWSNLVNIESDIEKLLTDYIREELNNNSFGVIFRLGFWVKTDDYGKMEIQVKDGYHGEDKQFVPVVIEDYDGQILALEGIFNAEYTLPLTFQIPVDDKGLFGNTIDAINEVKNRNRAQMRRFKRETKTGEEYYTAVVATNNLTPIGDTDIQKGKNYAFGNINFFFDISKDVIYGNQIHVYMSEDDDPDPEDWVRLYPLDPTFVRENTPETIQTYDQTQAQTVLQEGEYAFAFGLIMKDDDLHWSIMSDIVNKAFLQNPRSIKLEFKYFDGEDLKTKMVFEDKVVLLTGQLNFAIGEETSTTLVFKKFLQDENEE